MQGELQVEKKAQEKSAFLGLPATRWDRLVAVLEENEPERAIDAPHIIERAKKLGMSDLDLFYLLIMRYQDNMSENLMATLSLYAMMNTWMDWIKQVQRCFDVKKGKVDACACRPTANSNGLMHSRAATDVDFRGTSRSGSNLGGSQHSSPLIGDSFSTGTSDSGGGGGRDSGLRAGRNRGHSNLRSHRNKSNRAGHSSSLHWTFDLGANWEWDGTLDFLRDGRVLSTLVEEALDHCGKLGDLQDGHRAHTEQLNRGTFDVLYPSLADIDRSSKEPGGGAHSSPAAKAAPFDPVSYLSAFDRSRLSANRRGAVPISKAMKLIEQQGRNLAAAEQWVTKVNGLCEHFLGWKKMAHKGELFMDIVNSDTLIRPLNADDKRLLYRLHWLAVALYRTVKDPTIIPAPPRMSFIVCRDDFTGVLDTSEEDNEIGLLVATKCSCLPLDTKLSVTMRNFNIVQLSHPKMRSGPDILPCTLVQGETFVYYSEYQAFMPIWCVLQYYIRKYDGIPWRFEPNRQERDRATQVLGSASSNTRKHTDPNSRELSATGSGAVFDLTVQSSAVRGTRDAHGDSSTMTRHTRTALKLSGAMSAAASAERPALTNRSATVSPPAASAAKSVAFATVRRNRVTEPPPAASGTGVAAAPATHVSVTAPLAHPPLPSPPRTLETEPSLAETVERRRPNLGEDGAGLATESTADLASNSITNHSTTTSSTAPSSRQITGGPSMLMLSAGATMVPEDAAGPAAVVADSAFFSPAELGQTKKGDSAFSEAASATAPPQEETPPLCIELAGAEDGDGEDGDAGVGISAATAVITPSCTISCSPSSQVMVTREAFNDADLDFDDAEGEMLTEVSMLNCSESRRMLRNFTASVVQESERNGIAILSHHFRVSGGPIGKGAFGAVYKALNLDTGRIVAVKQSRVSYDDKTTDLNWREFQMWSMLPLHANVIIFYGASKEVDTHQLLLVMEYASGGSIVQLYRQFRPIPEPLFYDHACGMARGIKHLHDHNVIHGDVKPENVLTRSDGSVAITDFGCSRFSIVTSDSDSSTLRPTQKDSSSWQLFGTAAYMAPEVILNEPHLKSDVWAYACTLLQLWLGKSPWSGGERHFSAQDSIPLMFYIANEDVVPFTEEQMANTPRWLQRVAKRSFEREVDRRCTMGEVIGILNEYSRAYVQ